MTLRALTIQQPWAWAIAAGHKDIENRPGPAWKYRGPLAIHAGKTTDVNGWVDPQIRAAVAAQGMCGPDPALYEARMAVVAVADLTDVHRMDVGCCTSPWRQIHGGVHLVLGNVRALPDPVPCRGAQGLWFLPDDVETAVRAAVRLEETVP